MSTRADEIARKAANVTLAYHRVFNHEDGKLILENLNDLFRFDQPCFTFADGKGNQIPTDSHLAAQRDGARSVYLHIQAILAKPATPDGNTQPVTKVITSETTPSP